MANVYVRITPGGTCFIQKDGEEHRYSTLREARDLTHDAEVAFALLKKSGRLAGEDSLVIEQSLPLDRDHRVLTGRFEQRGCQYRVSLFTEKIESKETLQAVQVFPAQDVQTYLDLHVTDPDLLEASGFLESGQLFLRGK